MPIKRVVCYGIYFAALYFDCEGYEMKEMDFANAFLLFCVRRCAYAEDW